MIGLCIFGIVLLAVLVLINLKVRKTNKYREFYRSIHVVKDIPTGRQYQIGVFGSTFAYYAFDLKPYNGHNFSIAPQGFDYMEKTVEHFIGNIQEGGTVALALTGCIFAAEDVSPDENCVTYQAFLKTEDFIHPSRMRKLKYYLLRYLPICSVNFAKALLHDIAPQYDCKKEITRERAVQLAKQRMAGWVRNTAVRSFDPFDVDENLNRVLDCSVWKLDGIIEMVIASKRKPVIVLLPVSAAFHEVCPREVFDRLLYGCVHALKRQDVKILDYLYDKELTDNSLFWSADCMNVNGRELLTHRLISDLEEESNTQN